MHTRSVHRVLSVLLVVLIALWAGAPARADETCQ